MSSMDAEKLFERAHALEEAGEVGQAASVYKQLVEVAADPSFHIEYGHCLRRLGHWQQSIVQLEQGVALKPHYCESDARVMLAESYWAGGQKAKAIDQWRIVAAMKPEYPSYGAPIDEARAKLAEHT